VDGEVGRFVFETHGLSNGDRIKRNTADELFTPLKAREFYKTTGFKDISMIYGDVEKSYRKTTKLINRIRHQENGGTPSRTLHENTEKEGSDLLDHIMKKSKSILTENEMRQDGKMECVGDRPVLISEEEVAKAIVSCREDCRYPDNLSHNPVAYEAPESTVNIAIDDVGVKKQEENRDGPKKTERGKRKYIHNTICHVWESGNKKYTLNGHGIKNVLLILTAFIFNNERIGNRFQFFTDGHTVLNKNILDHFDCYKNIGIILDWHHLEEKCKKQLSSAMNGRDVRNRILNEIKPLLWYGLTNEVIEYLEKIEDVQIKNTKAMNKLIKYLERNTSYIPCYAVRKKLGLCNSSAIGEKMNDLVVSERQKHNGMSWSKDGSVALATITALKRNKENKKWFEEKEIDFKFAA